MTLVFTFFQTISSEIRIYNWQLRIAESRPKADMIYIVMMTWQIFYSTS
jgi:hypothetical protein